MKKENIFIILGVMAVLVTGINCLNNVNESIQAEQLYNSLATQTYHLTSDVFALDDVHNTLYLGATNRVLDKDMKKCKPISSANGVSTEETPQVVLDEYKDLYSQNSDMAGWISVGEQINYPIMKCAEDENFYLHNDFNKLESSYGALYLSEESKIGQKGINVIYGHSMKDGSMFGSLKKYLDADYLEENKVIQIDSIYENMRYEVVAVFKSQIYMSNEEVFRYYSYKGDVSEGLFQDYINGVSNIAEYNNLESVKYGDSLIELVTCNYHVENGRLVVLCKKI